MTFPRRLINQSACVICLSHIIKPFQILYMIQHLLVDDTGFGTRGFPTPGLEVQKEKNEHTCMETKLRILLDYIKLLCGISTFNLVQY